jgi:hypothetical protein
MEHLCHTWPSICFVSRNQNSVPSPIHDLKCLVFCVVLYRSLFVSLAFFLWPLYCLSFDLRRFFNRYGKKMVHTKSSLLMNSILFIESFNIIWCVIPIEKKLRPLQNRIVLIEKFQNTKSVIRSRKSKKDRQHNGQTKNVILLNSECILFENVLFVTWVFSDMLEWI